MSEILMGMPYYSGTDIKIPELGGERVPDLGQLPHALVAGYNDGGTNLSIGVAKGKNSKQEHDGNRDEENGIELASERSIKKAIDRIRKAADNEGVSGDEFEELLQIFENILWEEEISVKSVQPQILRAHGVMAKLQQWINEAKTMGSNKPKGVPTEAEIEEYMKKRLMKAQPGSIYREAHDGNVKGKGLEETKPGRRIRRNQDNADRASGVRVDENGIRRCVICGGNVSFSSGTCPHCGASI